MIAMWLQPMESTFRTFSASRRLTTPTAKPFNVHIDKTTNPRRWSCHGLARAWSFARKIGHLSRNHAVETQRLLGLFAQGHRREALPDT